MCLTMIPYYVSYDDSLPLKRESSQKQRSQRIHRFSITDNSLSVSCCDQFDQCGHDGGDESFDTPV
jgi:hypothetical protein